MFQAIRPLQKLERFGLCLLILALVAVLTWQTDEWLHAPTTQLISKHWQHTECGFGSVQPDEGAWKACKIPHNWDIQNPNYSGDAWYRLTLPSASTQQALWMFASMNAEVWLNHHKLASGGSMEDPVSRHWNDALLFTIPSQLLSHPTNQLTIRVHGYANNSSGISTLITGAYQPLHAMHQRIQFRSNLLTFGALSVTVLVGCLTLILSLWGNERTLIYFSLGCLASTLYLLDQVIVNIPVSRDLWECGAHLSIIWSQIFFLLFLTRFLKFHAYWMTITLLIYGCLATLVLFNSSSEDIIPTAAIWDGISLFFLCIVMGYSLYRWYIQGHYLDLVSGLALSSVIMTFMQDWLPLMLGYGVNPPFLFYMGPIGFIIIMGAILIVRLANAYRYEQSLSIELGDVLWRNAKELEEARKQADQIIQKRAALEERDHIIRELHDGVGGLLANTLTVLHPSEIQARSQLTEALNELRMMMGTLDADADISSLLGLHRSKLQSVINAAGVTMNWEFYDVPAAIPDNTNTGMQLVRVVQECVYNALRHGNAKEITVHIDQSHCWVSDNGCGFDVAQVQSGRGLKNLQWRAEQLHANFNIFSNASGTKISLFWDERCP